MTAFQDEPRNTNQLKTKFYWAIDVRIGFTYHILLFSVESSILYVQQINTSILLIKSQHQVWWLTSLIPAEIGRMAVGGQSQQNISKSLI
jgi:hypothetical protein